jgi:hypothetical protein
MLTASPKRCGGCGADLLRPRHDRHARMGAEVIAASGHTNPDGLLRVFSGPSASSQRAGRDGCTRLLASTADRDKPTA